MSITVPLVRTAAVIIENPPGSPSPVLFKLRLICLGAVCAGLKSVPCKVSPKDFGRAEAAVPILHHPRVTHVDTEPCHQPFITLSPLQAALTPRSRVCSTPRACFALGMKALV